MSPQILESYNYHRWIFEAIEPYILAHVLEVGTGHGIFTELISHCSRTVYSVDLDANVIKHLKMKLSSLPNLRLEKMDITTEPLLTFSQAKIDTAVLINILEHVEDDASFLGRLHEILVPVRGHLILFVPSFPFLYGPMDKFAGHYRRYRKKALQRKMASLGFETVKTKYFNFIGIFAWYLNNFILKPKSLKDEKLNRQIRYFDKCIIPIYKKVDSILSHLGGQNLIYIGKAV